MDKWRNNDIQNFDKNKMEQTISIAKSEYNKQILSETTNGIEFMFQQMLYIKKGYWLTQFAIFIVAAAGILYLDSAGIHINRMSYAAIFTPLLVIFSIPELWKNIITNTMEIENTTYYDLRKVYFSRILLVGMLDLMIISLLTVITVNTIGDSLYETIIYFFVPFNFNCCICFSLLCQRRKISTELLAVGCCVSAGIIWYIMVKYYKVYQLLQIKIWYFLLLLSIVYMIYSMKRTIEISKEYLEVYRCSYK